MPIEIRRMWEGGPLRRWSDTAQRSQAWNYYESPTLKGYAGSYVCEGCQESVVGVYFVGHRRQWLCAACKEKVRTTKANPSSAQGSKHG